MPKQQVRHLLGLPNIFTSKFKVSADFTKSEPKQLTEWKKYHTFYQVRKSRKHLEKFVLHDGPPYANGKAHAGHAVNKILKDVITKHKTLSSFNSPLILGWDCHGMPIETQMTKATKAPLPTKLMLIREARSYAKHQMEDQYKDLRRLGLLSEKKESYSTMSGQMETQEVKMFQSLLLRGAVHRRTKPLPWCFSCKTNLADVETKNQQNNKTGAIVVFPFYRSKANLKKSRKLLGITSKDAMGGICVWTTTPWTLMANKALSFNPNDNYILAKSNWNLVTCSEKMLGQFVFDAKTEMTILRILRGDIASQLKFQHPFASLLSKFWLPLRPLLDPTIRKGGTGAVHIAPAHGIDDFQLCLAKMPQLPNNSLSKSGLHKSILLRRRKITSAGAASLAWTNFTRNLVRCKAVWSTVTKCQRHQSETVVRSLTQWFLDVFQLLGPSTWEAKILRSLRTINFPIEADRQHLIRAVTVRPDWCLTRQKSWGVPISILENKKTKNLHPFTIGMMDAVSEEVRLLGIEAWLGSCLLNFRRKESSEYQKATDTLDVWFDSGTSWNVLKSNPMLSFPADLYLEGTDQFRGWFYSSLVTSVVLNGVPPTKSFISHGFVINDQGKKLSKSANNFDALVDLINQEGADVLRMLVMSLDYHKDVRLTNKCLRETSDCYRKIRNTFKFILSNLFDFVFSLDCIPIGHSVEIDVYLLSQTKKAQSELRRQLNLFNLREALKLIVQFSSEELGKFYFEILKDRLYSPCGKSSVRRSAQNSLYYIANFLAKSVVPFLPFASEEVWNSLRPERCSILVEHYHSFPIFCETLTFRWEFIRLAREENMRVIGTLKNRKATGDLLAVLTQLSTPLPSYWQLQSFGTELKGVLSTSKVRLSFRIVRPNPPILNLMLKYNKCIRCWLRFTSTCSSNLQAVCSHCKRSFQLKEDGRRLL